MEPDEVEEEVARHSLDQRIPLTRQECTEGAGGGGAVAVRTTWSVEDVVELAEKYFDRVNAAQLLELLPAHTPVACLLRFFKIVLEYGSAQKRNLQRKSFPLNLGLTSASVKSIECENPTVFSVFVAPDVVSYMQMPNNARKARLLVSRKHTTDLTEFRNMIESKLVELTGQPYKLRYRLSSQPHEEPKPINNDNDIRFAMESSTQLSSTVQLFIRANPGVFPPAQAEYNNSKLHSVVAEMRASHIDPADSEFYTMISFYAFSNIEDPEILAQDLERLWQPFQALGRVYVAKEGINAQLAVPDNAVKYFEAATRGVPQLSNILLNCDSSVPRVEFSVTKPFRALHVRARDQVLTDGFGANKLDWEQAGSEMHPREWHQRISSVKKGKENAVVIDCRNSYESDVGIFEGAVPLNTTFFRESWPVLEELLRDTPKDTPVLTYCTGGIRCVKVNAFLQQRLGFTNTHRLQGGIVAYNREIKTQNTNSTTSSMFRGVNFVFDARMKERITDDVLTICEQCAIPCDSFTNCQNYACNIRFLQCERCGIQYGGCCSKVCQSAFSLLMVKEQQSKQGILSRKARRSVAETSFQQEEAILHAASSPAVLMESPEPNGEDGLMKALAQYCEEHSTQEPATLAALREETLCLYKNSPSAARMLCDPLQGRILAMLSTLTRARYVLELGAFTGYSAISLALGLGGDDAALHRRVITCEPNTVCRSVAEKHIQQIGLVDHIDLRSTTAMEVIGSLRCDPTPHLLDLVFIDADKKRYRDYVQALLGDDHAFEDNPGETRPMLRDGALIVVDNTLWKGLVLSQQVGSSLKASTSPRMMSIADSMRSFNDFVASEPRLQTVMLPLRDGLTVMRYRSNK